MLATLGCVAAFDWIIFLKCMPAAEVSVFAILTTHWIVINQFIPDTKIKR